MAALALVLEAGVSVAFGVLALTDVDGPQPGIAIGSGLLLLGYAGALLVLARGVRGARGWARGPGVAISLLNLLTGWSLRTALPAGVVVGVLIASVVVLVGLLTPSATAAFTTDREANEAPPE